MLTVLSSLTSGLARSECLASTSSFTRCSGVPVAQVSSDISSVSTRGCTPKRKAPAARLRARAGRASHGKRRRKTTFCFPVLKLLDASQSRAAILSGQRGVWNSALPTRSAMSATIGRPRLRREYRTRLAVLRHPQRPLICIYRRSYWSTCRAVCPEFPRARTRSVHGPS